MGMTIYIMVLWIYSIHQASGAILCVDCQSQNDVSDGDCELRPPASTRCNANARYCTITKEYDTEGVIINFIRSCSPNNHGDQCVTNKQVPLDKRNGPARYCTTTCDSDGCNVAHRIGPLSLCWLILTAIITFCLYRQIPFEACAAIS